MLFSGNNNWEQCWHSGLSVNPQVVRSNPGYDYIIYDYSLCKVRTSRFKYTNILNINKDNENKTYCVHAQCVNIKVIRGISS